MARKRAHRKIVTKDEDGKPVEINVGEVIDYAEPQKDGKTGVVPEFVNISNKIQLLTIPYNRDGTLTIPRFGIVRGAQWRYLSESNKKIWGDHPWFMERQVNGDNVYDEKYLLSEDQMIEEIKVLVRRRAIRDLLNNSIIDEPDEEGPTGPILHRSREDRPAVADIAMQRLIELEEKERARKKELGILDEETY